MSLLDPPGHAAADAASCTQHRCWPVMVADDAGTDAVLVSPIVLGDHPSIAPESAGDLFDATEIDEILTLRVMTMTDQEKAEARGTDPRAAAILDRCDTMTDDALALLHGARRSATADGAPDGRRAAGAGGDVPWWDEGQDARAEPESDAVLVGDVAVAKGSRVLLRPSRRADAQDLFLAGQTAVVSRVYFDVDGGTHLAVVLEDDPGRDLYDTTGRFYYFGPDEVEPLPAREDATRSRPSLVAGIGNLFLTDDGFGSEVARRLAAAPPSGDVKVVDYGIRGMHLAYDLLDGYDALVVVDAVPGDGAPGDLSVLEVGDGRSR